MDPFLQMAIDEARLGLAEGGIPIGSVLVVDGRVVGRGHNRRVQNGSAILHAEMDCLENAGRLKPADYRRAVLYSTLSPCDMCSGTALLYRIPKIVIGENRTFQGPEDYVRSRGVELVIVDDAECIQLMRDFIAAQPGAVERRYRRSVEALRLPARLQVAGESCISTERPGANPPCGARPHLIKPISHNSRDRP